jgi:hypothetical protein
MLTVGTVLHVLISVVASYRQTLVDQRGTSAGRCYQRHAQTPKVSRSSVKSTETSLSLGILLSCIMRICQPWVGSSGNVAQPEHHPICRVGGQHARLKLLLDQPGFYRVNKSSIHN